MRVRNVYPLERRKGVHRFLVTAKQESQIQNFWLSVMYYANWIERRGLTWLLTVADEGHPEGYLVEFIRAAEENRLTVQQRVERVIDGKLEFWAVVVAGDAKPWKPKPKEAAKHS